MTSSKQKQTAASGRNKPDYFVWTDSEVELLLKVTNEYKVRKAVEDVDWETCQTKYSDIFDLYTQKYPVDVDAYLKNDFPHGVEEITKPIVITKIKAIRHKYRQAVDSGRKNGHGRVILLFFELCEQIWGGSQATETISDGFKYEINDKLYEHCSDRLRRYSTPSPASTSTVDSDSVEQATADGRSAGDVLNSRREGLGARLSSYRPNKLKRKLPNDGQLTTLAQEDLKIKKQILERMEATDKEFSLNMSRLASNIERLTNSITEGFTMMRQMMVNPLYNSPPPYMTPNQNDSSLLCKTETE